MASADRLIEVFNEAKARPAGAERDHFLSQACQGDPELKEQVLSLLQAHEGAGDFLKNTQAIPPVTVLTEKLGDKIGRYKLLQKIGEGGCGVVYMAEQEEPVRRRVAFKVIKLGMDTKQVVARFEAEGQALAMMDHPNIAKVFDAGATHTGRPYFVMELVRGIKITEYCDQNNLPTEERLKLITQICHAIQHAHQKGIIHRDIKPSNILVTINDGVPVPKVIDFGIAKAIEQRLTDKTVFTAFEQFIGTPAYMSPEQAEMTSLDIDTRADIYSLGVLLYELLSGNTPFDAEKLVASGIAEIRRIIREQEPPKPSTRLNTLNDADLGTVAQRRQTDPPKLIHLLRGDLDWIVMKCLEKDRTRRYETANGLAMDLQRHLDDEPVFARPPSTAYRFQKFVRRNKLAFAAASAVAAALVLGLGMSTWLFFKEKQAHQRAVAAEQEQARLRRQAEAEAAESRRVATYLGSLAQSLHQEQNPARSDSAYRESLAMWMRLFGKANPEVDDALSSLAQVLQRGKLAETDMAAREAAQKCHAAMAQFEKLASEGNHHYESWFIAAAYESLGLLLQQSGQTQEAEKAYRDTLVLWRKMVAVSNQEDHRFHLAVNYDWLGNLLREAGRPTESLEAYRQALAIWKKLVAEFKKDDYRNHLSWTLNSLFSTLQTAGKRTEAELVFREAEFGMREELALRRQRFGDVHREVEVALASLAQLLRRASKLAEAEVVWREELAVERKLSGDEHLFVANSLHQLATVLRDSGKWSEAEALFRQALGMRRKLLGNENITVVNSLSWIGATLSDQGKHPEAEAAYRETLALQRKLPADDPQLAEVLARLTRTLLVEQKFTEAETTIRECLTIREKKLPDDWLTFNARSMLGGSLLGQKKFTEAEPLLFSGYEGMKVREDKIPANGKVRLQESIQRLVQLYEAMGQAEQAAEWNKTLAEFDKAEAETKAAAPKP